MKKLLNILKENQGLKNLILRQNDIVVNSINDEALLTASAFLASNQDMIIVKQNQYEANLLYQQLSALIPETLFFPVDESYRIESLAASSQLQGQRIGTLYELCFEKKHLLVTHVHAVMRYLPEKEVFLNHCIKLRVGEKTDIYELQRKLLKAGYMHTTQVDQPFYFSKRGEVIDVFSMQYDHPVRIDFFDDEIDYIKFYDEKTQRTIENAEEIVIIPASDVLYEDQEISHVMTAIKDLRDQQYEDTDEIYQDDLEEKVAIDLENIKSHSNLSTLYAYFHLFKHVSSLYDYCHDPLVVVSHPDAVASSIKAYTTENFYYYQELSQIGKFLKGLKLYQDFYAITPRYLCFKGVADQKDDAYFHSHEISFHRGSENETIQQIKEYLAYHRVLICVNNNHQLQLMIELFDRHQMKYTLTGIQDDIYDGINLYVGQLVKGIELLDERVIVLTAHELFGEVTISKPKYFKYKNARVIKNYQELHVGDYVVHDHYGIGQYLGIKTLEVKGYHKDYLYVAYAGDDTLYIPVEQFKMIRKYASAHGKVPVVHSLGSSKWEKAKIKARSKIDDIADQLISLYAKRMSQEGFAFSPDTDLQIEFEKKFGYELTLDQQQSLDEIKADMEKPQPMDRLLCGDVGFGKTEVALRAAFKAIVDHKQVAFLCPTTILSMQHYKTALSRFIDFPVEIALLNRFTSTKQKKQILSDLEAGKIDLLIGTHRILSKDIHFKDIGLLIIDEEQRFGVRQKEKIKSYRETIDVLVLSATPIPRTLQMSLMGIRGLSQIETPPKNRLPVQTYVIEKNNVLIKQVIERELARNGQVFYLYNRTQEIENVAYHIASMIPNAKVAVGHGQMNKDELEDVMMRFMNKEFNVLVCTTIVETGIDIPNANTIIVEDADRFGLAQLYQIRGRVGRSDRGAYAYLLYRKNKVINEDAMKRLQAIKEFTQLGSGYKIAMRDLSIRGSGDILGGKQAGFIDDIGFEMYMKILQDALDEKMGVEKQAEEDIKNLNINVDGYIPEDYVDSDYEKLELYQKLDRAKTVFELDGLKNEFTDYYGRLPKAIDTLLAKRKLDILSHDEAVDDILEIKNEIEIRFSDAAAKKIAGDQLFIKANQLFTKPRFKAFHNKISIVIKKDGQWLNHLIELLEMIKKNNKTDTV